MSEIHKSQQAGDKHRSKKALNVENLLIAFGSALLFFMVLSYSLNYVAFDKSFYYQQYEKNGIYDIFSKSQVSNATEELLTYLKYGKNEFIQSSFFNQKEKLHLIDVKNLLQKEFMFCNVITILFIIILIALYCYYERNPYSKIAFTTGFVGLGILLFLGLLSAISFNVAFTAFHLILFDNDLWMLSSYTDNLIMLYPEEFFIAIALRWAMFAIIGYVILLATGYFLQTKAQSH